MAELATIARPYAEALYQAAGAQAATQLDWLDALALVAGDAGLLQWAANPNVSGAQVQELILGLLPAVLPPLGRDFLRTVIENRRLNALPEVARQVRERLNARLGCADAWVESAFALDANAQDELRQVLEQRFGRALKLQVQVLPELIGGVRVRVGDEVLDTSIQARLEQMRVALTA